MLPSSFPAEMWKLLIIVYSLIAISNAGNLSPSENNERLEKCGRRILSVHKREYFSMFINEAQVHFNASYISKRHILSDTLLIQRKYNHSDCERNRKNVFSMLERNSLKIVKATLIGECREGEPRGFLLLETNRHQRSYSCIGDKKSIGFSTEFLHKIHLTKRNFVEICKSSGICPRLNRMRKRQLIPPTYVPAPVRPEYPSDDCNPPYIKIPIASKSHDFVPIPPTYVPAPGGDEGAYECVLPPTYVPAPGPIPPTYIPAPIFTRPAPVPPTYVPAPGPIPPTYVPAPGPIPPTYVPAPVFTKDPENEPVPPTYVPAPGPIPPTYVPAPGPVPPTYVPAPIFTKYPPVPPTYVPAPGPIPPTYVPAPGPIPPTYVPAPVFTEPAPVPPTYVPAPVFTKNPRNEPVPPTYLPAPVPIPPTYVPAPEFTEDSSIPTTYVTVPGPISTTYGPAQEPTENHDSSTVPSTHVPTPEYTRDPNGDYWTTPSYVPVPAYSTSSVERASEEPTVEITSVEATTTLLEFFTTELATESIIERTPSTEHFEEMNTIGTKAMEDTTTMSPQWTAVPGRIPIGGTNSEQTTEPSTLFYSYESTSVFTTNPILITATDTVTPITRETTTSSNAQETTFNRIETTETTVPLTSEPLQSTTEESVTPTTGEVTTSSDNPTTMIKGIVPDLIPGILMTTNSDAPMSSEPFEDTTEESATSTTEEWTSADPTTTFDEIETTEITAPLVPEAPETTTTYGPEFTTASASKEATTSLIDILVVTDSTDSESEFPTTPTTTAETSTEFEIPTTMALSTSEKTETTVSNDLTTTAASATLADVSISTNQIDSETTSTTTDEALIESTTSQDDVTTGKSTTFSDIIPEAPSDLPFTTISVTTEDSEKTTTTDVTTEYSDFETTSSDSEPFISGSRSLSTTRRSTSLETNPSEDYSTSEEDEITSIQTTEIPETSTKYDPCDEDHICIDSQALTSFKPSKLDLNFINFFVFLIVVFE